MKASLAFRARCFGSLSLRWEFKGWVARCSKLGVEFPPDFITLCQEWGSCQQVSQPFDAGDMDIFLFA